MPTWKRLAESDTIKRSSQTLAAVGNEAYIYGGELHPREPVDSELHVVRLGKDTTINAVLSTININETSPIPQPRVGSASTSLNGEIYIFSGRGGVAMAPLEEKGSFLVFSTDDSTWTQITPKDANAPYPAGRSYHAITSNGTDTIYIHAGCPEKGRLNDLWSFNVHTREWKELASAPGPPRGGASIAFSQGKLWRMNGFDGKTELGGNLEVYDPMKDAWSTITYAADGIEGPTPRSVSCLLAIKVNGSNVLVTMFGERDPSNLGHAGAGKMLGDVWVYDYSSEMWEEVKFASTKAVPPPRGWFAADVVAGGDGRSQSIVVHGGLSESNERLGDVWLLEF